jgi:hypothetical protein
MMLVVGRNQPALSRCMGAGAVTISLLIGGTLGLGGVLMQRAPQSDCRLRLNNLHRTIFAP